MVPSMNTRRTSPNRGSAVIPSNSRRSPPEAAHRRDRLYAASHAPNPAGRSRHGMPVRLTYSRASKNTRSGTVGGCPPRCRLACRTNDPIAAQRSSVSMYRIAVPPGAEARSASTRCAVTPAIVNRP